MTKINFSPFPDLAAGQIILRQLKIEDENEIFILRSDERVLKYLDIPKAQSIDEARQFINKIQKAIATNESIYWAVAYKNEPKLVGTICLWNISEDKTKAEIGFELLPDYFGKGIMKEAIPTVIKYGFETIGLNSIEGEVDPDNLKSIRLMEKFGFVYSRKLEKTVIYSLVNKALGA